MSAKIEIIHTFNAAREIVFKAFTQAEHLRNWWGPKESVFKYFYVRVQPGWCLPSYRREIP